jgi:ketosteroid isomerase-like protein
MRASAAEETDMKMMHAYPVLMGAAAISAAAVIAGCDRGESRQANEAAAEVTASWSKAFDSGDPAALAAIYAADAHSLPTAGVRLSGREQIESYWRVDIGEGGVTTTLTPLDALVDGDLLHIEGTYQVKGLGEMELARGQYQQLWARSGDGWQVQREMWRTDPELQRSIDVADRLTAAWTNAYNAGDAQALVAMYAKDGVLSTVQDGSFEGPTAIELFWTRDFGGSKPSSTLTLTDVYMSGDLAHLEGEYKVVEGKTETEGRFVQLWMRDGDAWRIHREMWLR